MKFTLSVLSVKKSLKLCASAAADINVSTAMIRFLIFMLFYVFYSIVGSITKFPFLSKKSLSSSCIYCLSQSFSWYL